MPLIERGRKDPLMSIPALILTQRNKIKILLRWRGCFQYILYIKVCQGLIATILALCAHFLCFRRITDPNEGVLRAIVIFKNIFCIRKTYKIKCADQLT